MKATSQMCRLLVDYPKPRRLVKKWLFPFIAMTILLTCVFYLISDANRVQAALPTDLYISEYVEGTSYNKALEIYNGTGATVDLTAGGYDIQVYYNGSATAGATIALTGTVAAGDVYVIAHPTANALILAQADQKSSNISFNGDDAAVLRKNAYALDVIGQIGFDPGSEWGTGLTSTMDNTLRRKDVICTGDPIGSDAFDPALEWDGYASDTFDGLGTHSASCSPDEPKLNEFSASTTGNDVEWVEIYGSASTAYSAYTVLEIEGDTGNVGVVDEVIAIGSTDPEGFWVVNLANGALENGTLSLLLVKDFTGALGNDLDTNDDGVFEATPWSALTDAVSVNDGGATDKTYGIPALGPNYDGLSIYAPGGASRWPDGFDTESATDWVRNDFELAGIPGYPGTIVPGEAYNTPGEPNAIYVAPPASLSINKAAPVTVETNATYTYTLTVNNDLGITATNVVITDSLPLSLTVGDISDGGELLAGNVVSWTVASLADGTTADRTVSVLAPITETTLVNFDYGVQATEWITFTLGDPVTTTVNAPLVITPIAEARAAGDGWTGLIQGNVTVVPGKIANNSFAIQDATGGIYVYPASAPTTLALGDLVQVQGTIDNFNGLLEMTSITNITVVGPGTPPDPTVTQTGIISDTQGLLIQIQGTVTSITGTGNKTIKVDDGSGEGTVYIYTRTGIITTGITAGMEMRFIGLSYNYNHAPQLTPRYQTDLYVFPPEVTGTYPTDEATGASLYRPLTATFNHAMDSTTINAASFTVSNSSGPVSGGVTYDPGSHTAIFTPETHLAETTQYTATLTTAIKDVFNIALPATYTWSFTSGVVDLTSPVIVDRLPAPGDLNVPLDASVVITYSEDLNPASLDEDDFAVVGPYGDVPFDIAYDSSSFAVTLHPYFSLLPTSVYTVTAFSTVADWAGNSVIGDSTWSFTTMAEPTMYVYWGDLHNHTSYSDGSGTPDQALAAGKAAGLDFMAISDHSYAINDTEWAQTLVDVDYATTSDFLALRGFEYTQGAEGHINVYNTVRHAVRTNTGCGFCDYTPNLEAGSTVMGFYQWLASTGMIGLDDAGTIAQFNHPGWINFNDWRFHPEVSDVARLEEVGNGNGTSYAFSEDQYIRSLDYGWKVGATNNADTHTADWGTNTDHRTGVVMPELTKEALLDALRLRRTFASEDKNYSLRMKANGAWMGSEIPNVSSIEFEISGEDADNELTVLVEIITNQGVVAAQFMPNSATFTWTPTLDITAGVHYYYVRVTEADGDRIVSSPVWTTGSEDISVTDLLIQPTIPTIHNPSLLTVRVTNRVEMTRTVTVAMDVNGTPLNPSVELDVPGNADAFANFTWQPVITGEVTVTAQLTGAPVGDNPDDNHRSLNLTVTDEQLPLILIDAGHGNLNAGGNEMQMFINDLSDHRYNVLKNLDNLTSADLDPAIVKLLIITAPEIGYSEIEIDAIANYVVAGGNLWMIGMSDYTGSVSWAGTVADRENYILGAIQDAIGSTINMRVNDDEIIDGDDNNGYVFGPRWSIFPSADTTGIGINVEAITSWSANSLRGLTVTDPLTPTTAGILQIVQGDLDEGYMNNPPYYDPYHTSNEDADNGNDAYIYNPTWVSPATRPAGAIPVPMSAAADLPGSAGRILLYGDSNDAFTTYAYTAGDGLQNELFNLEAVMWLMGEPLQKSTIAEARAQAAPNQPDNLDKLVWVEGYITAAYGEFFNVLYVQDDTGGITVHAPAGDIDASAYTRGTHVRVVGTIGIYNGDTEIEFFEAEMVQVLDPGAGEILPMDMSTNQASLEDNQGWLSVITGTVTSKIGEDTIFVDDGSGPVRIFLDGYNGDFADIALYDWVRVTGLVSEDGNGPRMRVRNHLMHPEYTDDVVILPPPLVTYLPVIAR